MANHKSALKKSKQDIVRRNRNRAAKSRLRSALKSYRALIAENNAEATAKLPAMISLIDKTAKGGYIHDNAASRLKARLTVQTTSISS